SHITGMDPLYFACEGNMVFVMKKSKGNLLIEKLNTIGYKKANIIGKIGIDNKNQHVILNTISGGRRFLSPTDIAQLPRIC
ncbi:hydrogenase expression/formation protein HypE, partial [bacterium]|nr:hydrogenase expression/formation protein HypE [bacterium]